MSIIDKIAMKVDQYDRKYDNPFEFANSVLLMIEKRVFYIEEMTEDFTIDISDSYYSGWMDACKEFRSVIEQLKEK